ncbi:MAG: hypothetical protein GX882_06040 [Methanomicrobiales archaeon]|nr:hypothetical protein [Methanomicrobiales archaeon]
MAEKKDFIYVVLAIAVVLLIALVVKPAVTGELALPWKRVETAPGPVTPAWTPGPLPTASPTTPPTPTPVPTWDGKPQKIGFVDPETYHIPAEETRVNMTTAAPPAAPGPTKWVTYATIDGRGTGTTGVISIPFPLWRLDYSDITTTNYEISRFNCQVMDAADPNHIVHIVTLFSSDFRGMKDKPEMRKEQWTETIREGNRDYYFIINALCIDAYHVKIQVPEGYVGK